MPGAERIENCSELSGDFSPIVSLDGFPILVEFFLMIEKIVKTFNECALNRCYVLIRRNET